MFYILEYILESRFFLIFVQLLQYVLCKKVKSHTPLQTMHFNFK